MRMGYRQRAWRICVLYSHWGRTRYFPFFISASTGDISVFTLEQADKLYTREANPRKANRQNLLAPDSRLTEPFALKPLKATDAYVEDVLWIKP